MRLLSAYLLTGFRPYLHVFAHSNELEETGIISLSGVNVESDPFKESLLGVSSFRNPQRNDAELALETIFVHAIYIL